MYIKSERRRKLLRNCCLTRKRAEKILDPIAGRRYTIIKEAIR